MSAILNFEKWKNLYEQVTPKKTTAPKAPEGFTSPLNGIVYKYPFADTLALNKYLYFGDANINAEGSTGDAASATAALKMLSPKLAGLNVVRKDEKRPAGEVVLDGVQTMLDVAAQAGIGPMMPDQILAKANAMKDEAGAKNISQMIEYLNFYETGTATKGAYTDFKANWPKVWAAQRKAAGLPETI